MASENGHVATMSWDMHALSKFGEIGLANKNLATQLQKLAWDIKKQINNFIQSYPVGFMIQIW